VTLLSGTFYSVDKLAPAFRAFSHFNPFFYIISGSATAFSAAADHRVAGECGDPGARYRAGCVVLCAVARGVEDQELSPAACRYLTLHLRARKCGSGRSGRAALFRSRRPSVATPALMPVYRVAGSGRCARGLLSDRRGRPALSRFASGIASTRWPWPPQAGQAIADQAATLMHVSNLYGSPQGEALAQRIVDNSFADTCSSPIRDRGGGMCDQDCAAFPPPTASLKNTS